MYRDFSNKSKKEIVELVSEVENEKSDVFTDWVGDRWYDFEYWIEELNIKTHLVNVNKYHEKVINKNYNTKLSIDKIFNNIESIDISYKKIFLNKKIELQKWKKYIDELNLIVNPNNGKFDADYIPKRMQNIFANIKEINGDDIKEYVKNLWGQNGYRENSIQYPIYPIVLITGNPSLATGIIITHLDKILVKKEVVDIQNELGLNIVTTILSNLSFSFGIENTIYEYFIKNLHPYEALKLDSKLGKTMAGFNIASDATATMNSLIDMYKVFVDSNSTIYDKVSESMKSISILSKLVGDVYIESLAKTKSLQIISSTGGSSKVVNQILVTEQKLEYTTSAAVSKKISTANVVIAIGSVVVSTIASGLERYGEVKSDGKVDLGDIGSIGIYASVAGLDTVVSFLTKGIIDFDSEKVASGLESVAADLASDVTEFVKGDSWAANIIRDEEASAPTRFVVSVGASAYILGENIVDGIANSAKTICSWGIAGWNTVTNMF